MYKLLIVDDEAEVVEGLAELSEWKDYHISEILCAYNGKEAIDCIERYEPDIVLTDISMPYMDGLALAQWIKKHYPLIKVIIISGYDDFHYAKQAIVLHVEEYILKPFSNSQCIEVVKRVIDKIEEERQAYINLQQLKVHYHVTLPIIREKFLSSLISRQMTASSLTHKAEKYNVDLDGVGYTIAVLSIEHHDPINPPAHIQSLVDSDDLDLKLFAVSNIATEMWKQTFCGEVFIHQEEVILLGINKDLQKDEFIEQARLQLKQLIKTVKKYLKIEATISIGRYIHEVSELKQAYESALNGLDYRKILEYTQLICIDDLERKVPSKLVFDENSEQLLIRTIKLGQKDELILLLNQLIDEAIKKDANASEQSQYVLDIVIAMQRFIKTLDDEVVKQLKYRSGLIQHYQKLQSLEDTKKWLNEVCCHVQEQIANMRQHTSMRLIQQALTYTNENYADSDLSVQKISQYFHLSAGYFSAVFKKSTGMSYGNYLLKYRMELAQEWLRTTDLKAFEIAERLGYADPNYFSLTFKKYTGMSAKEFRAKGE